MQDQRILLHGVSWAHYSQLLAMVGDEHPGLRITYLDGLVELMSPGDAHEREKKVLARLLETWAAELEIDLDGVGSTTFRSKAKARGLEADECYMRDGRKKVPDLAIEVVKSNPLLDKLEVYRGLRVREVWLIRRGKVTVHVLSASGHRYVEQTKSAVLPELDLALMLQFFRPEERQTPLVNAYRAALRAKD